MDLIKAIARDEARLEKHGYDGLYWTNGHEACGCGIGDLRPCGEAETGCVSARVSDDGEHGVLYYPVRKPTARQLARMSGE